MSDYQPKVSNLQKYEDSQNSHVVVPAKLILIRSNRVKGCLDNMSYDLISGLMNGSGKISVPILISEREIVTEDDWLFFQPKSHDNFDSNFIAKDGEYPETQSKTDSFYKILAFPQNFSDKQLQAIVEGKMENQSEVLVKCEDAFNETQGEVEGYYMHLDQQNHITLFPAKQSLEEAFCERFNLDSHDKDLNLYDINPWKAAQFGAEWAKKNNY